MKSQYDRICVLLRPGDFEVAEYCDELRAEQRRVEKARRKAWQMMLEDLP